MPQLLVMRCVARGQSVWERPVGLGVEKSRAKEDYFGGRQEKGPKITLKNQ
jgi:hypothetical protein